MACYVLICLLTRAYVFLCFAASRVWRGLSAASGSARQGFTVKFVDGTFVRTLAAEARTAEAIGMAGGIREHVESGRPVYLVLITDGRNGCVRAMLNGEPMAPGAS